MMSQVEQITPEPASTGPASAPTPIWPRPAAPAAPAVLRAAVLAGLAAAAAVPVDRPGIGWPLVAIALFGLTAVLTRTVTQTATPTVSSAGRPSGRGGRVAALSWGAAAVALSAVGAVRAAGWLFPCCLLGAVLAGSIAVAGGRSVRGLLLGAVAVPALAFGGLRWAMRGVADARRQEGTTRLVGALLVSAVLLGVFTPLLAGADPEFARLLPAISVPTVRRWALLFGVFGAGMIGAGYLCSGPGRAEPTGAAVPGRLRRLEWALPVGLLVALFGVFVGVQLTTLFGGDALVRTTTGLTYAEYARTGFWQLLVVTLLTLGVIAVVARHADTRTRSDRGWLRSLLGALSVLTLVIVASALSRMWAYQQAYGFTVARVLVLSFELWLGLVYLLILAAGTRSRAGWLPTAVAGTGLAALLGLALVNPDRLIAEQNIQRWSHTGKIDTVYLAGLSADAVPALVGLPEPGRTCTLAAIADRLRSDPDNWREWNLSRAAARAQLAGTPAAPAGSPHCPHND